MLCSEHPKFGGMSTATGTVTDIGGKLEILNALYDFRLLIVMIYLCNCFFFFMRGILSAPRYARTRRCRVRFR